MERFLRERLAQNWSETIARFYRGWWASLPLRREPGSGQAKFALQGFQRNSRLVAFKAGDALQIVLAILQILPYCELRLVALATPGFFSQPFQALLQFWIESDT
jgi:hypothetical protein